MTIYTSLVHQIFILLYIFTQLFHISTATTIGICYGRVANNLPQPTAAVNLINSNGISSIRLFNPVPESLIPFSGTGIQLTIGVPNEELPTIAGGTPATANDWLQANIFAHVSADQIRYLVVGNEVFLKDPFYTPHIIPAIINLHQALQNLGLSDKIKISSAQAASILSNSFPPSSSSFDPNILPDLTHLLQFLRDTSSPLMVNVYPYFSYINNPQLVSLDSALFRPGNVLNDQGLVYDNLFDQTIDAFIYAMEKEGFGGIPVVVTETGWPTAGGDVASGENALAYNGNVVKRSLNNVGTPKRPGIGVEVFLFDLFDENEKMGNEFEKHFGIFGVDGVKSYDLNFH
ncbi:glycosyl hydrolase superfamily protein [Artemisia annua]|uniref:Glycosyl hydrolase superfamily protein n=1 Tax=Artemisia annua TaxID=35608 RepID=A0A2U1Q2N5_ARTAN|nr:glycosyl hydrolase superfamily protein [Artemisia annua]